MGTLSLDLQPVFIPKSVTRFLAELSTVTSVTQKLLHVNDFVNRLESETRKIEAFQRELPLCMILINDAIGALKEEAMVLEKTSNVQPLLEEFMPLKNRFVDDDDDDTKVETVINRKDNGDKKNWLSSTHLWNTNESLNQMVKEKTEEEDGGRAMVNENSRLTNSCYIPSVQPNIQIGSTVVAVAPPQHHTYRKQRRCWSNELHRRFVNALQQLGGSQVATPKQIRELMKVDGLTNDEVKSHLQKYRLHTRRIPSSKTNKSCVDVEGRSWMSKSSNTKSGSPDGPLLNGGNNIDDEDDKSENYCWSGEAHMYEIREHHHSKVDHMFLCLFIYILIFDSYLTFGKS
ncbi:putative transcription factor MYB-HB-like family [Helianthus anomalus]